MSKYILLVISIAISAAFFACGEKKYTAEVKTIDSLNIVLDSIQEKLDNVDTIKLKKDYKQYLSNIGLLKKNFNDKKEDSTWQLMTSYGGIKSALKTFIRDCPGYYEEIRFSRGQLDTLKADIESGDLEPEKIGQYTKAEADAVSNLNTLVSVSLESVCSRLELLDSLNPKVMVLIKKLKEENNEAGDDMPSEVEDD